MATPSPDRIEKSVLASKKSMARIATKQWHGAEQVFVLSRESIKEKTKYGKHAPKTQHAPRSRTPLDFDVVDNTGDSFGFRWSVACRGNCLLLLANKFVNVSFECVNVSQYWRKFLQCLLVFQRALQNRVHGVDCWRCSCWCNGVWY